MILDFLFFSPPASLVGEGPPSAFLLFFMSVQFTVFFFLGALGTTDVVYIQVILAFRVVRSPVPHLPIVSLGRSADVLCFFDFFLGSSFFFVIGTVLPSLKFMLCLVRPKTQMFPPRPPFPIFPSQKIFFSQSGLWRLFLP